MSKVTYNTRQKKLIYDLLLKNRHSQLSCESIVDLLKEEGTPVGKTTVYRFLEALSLKGEVRKYVDSQEKTAVYQYIDKSLNCESHLHLKCISCGKLIHLGCEFMDSVGEHVLKHHNFRIDNSRTVILGCCEECSD